MNATGDRLLTPIFIFFLSRDESLNSIVQCDYLKEEKNN